MKYIILGADEGVQITSPAEGLEAGLRRDFLNDRMRCIQRISSQLAMRG